MINCLIAISPAFFFLACFTSSLIGIYPTHNTMQRLGRSSFISFAHFFLSVFPSPSSSFHIVLHKAGATVISLFMKAFGCFFEPPCHTHFHPFRLSCTICQKRDRDKIREIFCHPCPKDFNLKPTFSDVLKCGIRPKVQE